MTRAAILRTIWFSGQNQLTTKVLNERGAKIQRILCARHEQCENSQDSEGTVKNA